MLPPSPPPPLPLVRPPRTPPVRSRRVPSRTSRRGGLALLCRSGVVERRRGGFGAGGGRVAHLGAETSLPAAPLCSGASESNARDSSRYFFASPFLSPFDSNWINLQRGGGAGQQGGPEASGLDCYQSTAAPAYGAQQRGLHLLRVEPDTVAPLHQVPPAPARRPPPFLSSKRESRRVVGLASERDDSARLDSVPRHLVLLP
jgi:hypothetical protein